MLEAFKGRLRPDGYLFIPIVGGSGTGKSHLVRWVKAQTQNEPGWEIRYLPKNRTGLRRAIEIVIARLDGSENRRSPRSTRGGTVSYRVR